MRYPRIRYVTSSSSLLSLSTLLIVCFVATNTLVAVVTALFLHPRSNTARFQTQTSLNVGGIGWDNENFLESLGKGSDAIAKANAEYDRISKYGGGRRERLEGGYDNNDEIGAAVPPPSLEEDEISDTTIPGATLAEEQIERIKRQNDQENAGGGEMLRKLLERAQQQQNQRPPPQQPPLEQPPTLQVAGGPSLPDNFASLSVEQQAALFRELMFNQQPNTAPLPFQQEGPPLPQGGGGGPPVSKDGRRIGRNRDADAVVNTSDVYLAQLKIDSASRNRARYSGDVETANQVFVDPRIQEIKLHVNPYLEEQKKAERALYGGDTASFIQELAPILDSSLPDVSTPGIKYKDRLKERRNKNKPSRSKGETGTTFTRTTETTSTNNEDTTVSTSTSTTTTAYVPPPPVVETPTQPLELKQEVQAAEPVNVPEVQQNRFVTPPPPQPEVVVPPSQSVSEVVSQAPSNESPEDLRRDLRTLEGLLLKHRGGPGFGLGRLQGAEVQRFIDLADSVVGKLRSETPIIATTAQQQQQQPLPSATPPVSSSFLTVPTPVVQPSAPIVSAISQVPLTAERLSNMIACLEGSIQMYKFSPPGLRESVLVTIRAALLTALATCNEIINDADSFNSLPQSTPPRGDASTDQLASMIGYLEGAIQMYKHSPPELQKSVLVTVRAALFSAINTCNAVIADNEVANYAAYAAVRPQQQQQQQQQYTEVEFEKARPETTTLASAVPMYSGNDENSQFFELAYNKLKAAAGTTGRMGLRNNLSGSEAQDLADTIADMRSRLVAELETGIPESDSFSTSSNQQPSSAASKYQEMLAKARATNKEQ